MTSNSNVSEWWAEILGDGSEYSLDTSKDFVVCCNYLGSPYGTSSPVTPDPDKANYAPYAADIPTPAGVGGPPYMSITPTHSFVHSFIHSPFKPSVCVC